MTVGVTRYCVEERMLINEFIVSYLKILQFNVTQARNLKHRSPYANNIFIAIIFRTEEKRNNKRIHILLISFLLLSLLSADDIKRLFHALPCV